MRALGDARDLQDVLNSVYAGAVKECEGREHEGKLVGNGHHMAQAIVENVKVELLKRGLFVKFDAICDGIIEQVEVRAAQTEDPPYLIGPLIPLSAVVNDEPQPVRMWDDPLPSWLSAGNRDVQIGPPSPNPSRGGTAIPFHLRSSGRVRLEIYDVHGRFVRDLYNGGLPAGLHSLWWDGKTGDGRPVPRGLYLYRLHAAGRGHGGRIIVAG